MKCMCLLTHISFLEWIRSCACCLTASANVSRMCMWPGIAGDSDAGTSAARGCKPAASAVLKGFGGF